MSRSVLGHTVVRSEDPDLLTGRARFLADLVERGTLDAVFVRSAVPHGRLVSVEGAAARSRPGVDSVWTAEDLSLAPLGAPPALARPPLATDRVRFVREPVAVVLATSAAEGVDAAEAVLVDIEPLPADHPFRSLDNVLATPHIGYVARDLYRVFYGDTVRNITRWLAQQN